MFCSSHLTRRPLVAFLTCFMHFLRALLPAVYAADRLKEGACWSDLPPWGHKTLRGFLAPSRRKSFFSALFLPSQLLHSHDLTSYKAHLSHFRLLLLLILASAWKQDQIPFPETTYFSHYLCSLYRSQWLLG